MENNNEYTVNYVTYSRGDGTYDTVCQVKKYGAEICHCTWHPDGTIHCKDRHNNNISCTYCPLYGSSSCRR